jgi:hypothetical protein
MEQFGELDSIKIRKANITVSLCVCYEYACAGFGFNDGRMIKNKRRHIN